MDGLKTVFMIIGVINAVFAYTCYEKTCALGSCGPQSKCVADDTNGCVKHSVNDDFGVVHNCSSELCVPSWANISNFIVTTDCCFTDECNTDSMTSTKDDPAMDECYSAICDSVGCVKEAISNGNARLCPRSQNGYCMFVTVVQDTVSEIARCHEDSDEVQCTNTASYLGDLTTVMQCCTEERCNDGNPRKTPNVDNCYSVTCNGTGCIDEALQKGLFAYCPQTGFGCMTTVTDEVQVTTCAPQQCRDFSDGTVTIECCEDDLCNGHLDKGTTTGSTTTTPTPPRTTKKDTSGSSSLDIPHFIICSLIALLASVISYTNQ